MDNRAGEAGGARRRPFGRKHFFVFLVVILFGGFCLLVNAENTVAATAGLPFVEDFSTDTMKDAAGTNANWSTEERKVYLAWRHARYNVFGTGTAGTDITSDVRSTQSMAIGDVNGDGDLDVVAGNLGVNRLYLNNGTSNPFDGVTGTDITADAHSTMSIALGDVDGDGDLDVVAGNSGQTNRLYLNNGTANPFNGVTGKDITSDAHGTMSIALGDVDGDGDLDVVAGNSGQANRLYLNNGTANPFNGVSGTNISADAHNTTSIALRDVDGDGNLDMVTGDWGAGNRLYLNSGISTPFSGVMGTDITSDAHSTQSMAIGDVDGDGDLDVVAGNLGVNRLYLNNGTSDPFSGVAGMDITSDADSTYSIALGDLDGDGDLDVVAGNVGSANRLYLNNGTSTPFSGVMGTDITSDAHSTQSIALGDVDGDGDLDVVAGNSGQANRLYLNNGTANPFNGVSGANISADTHNTTSIALGDVDGDGDLDVVGGNSGQANRLYLNNGTANPFNGISGANISVDTHNTTSIALGDLDGDGDLDVVAGNVGSANRLYLNNGTANPFNGISGANISADTHNTTSIALGDVNGDGDLDVVAGNLGSANRLYLNNGTANPFNGISGTEISSDPGATYAVVLGDVDGDGDLDVVAGNLGSANRLHLNGSISTPFSGVMGTDITGDSYSTYAIAIGDIDDDGNLDVVAGNWGATNRLYLNNGTADPFSGVTGTDITGDSYNTYAIVIGDIDGDGDLDVMAGNYGQANRLYLNNGTADPFNGVSGSNISADAHYTISIALGDMDGDGDLDVVAGNYGQANRLYLNNGTADPFNGISGTGINSNPDTTFAIALGDVDGDGDLDVVVGNYGEANRLYLNNGTADPSNWERLYVTVDTRYTTSIALGDVDGDGDLDVVAGINGEANRLYLNNGTANPFFGVSGMDITSDANSTYAIALGDVDGDGDLDVVAGNNGEANRLYLNNGTTNPFNGVSGTDITSDIRNTASIALADVDGNGDLDVVAGNYQNRANRLYRRELYETSRGKVGSLTVDAEAGSIVNARLTPSVIMPANTYIDWYLTNNGGAKWFQVTPDKYFTFPTTGSDLRWRAQLRSLSPHRTPVVTQLLIETDTTPPTAAISYNPAGPYHKNDVVSITAVFSEQMSDSPVVQIAVSAPFNGGSALPPADMTKVSSSQYTYQYTVGDGNGTASVTIFRGADLAGNDVESSPTSGETFTVNKTGQTINVTKSAPASAGSNETFDVAASSDSGLDVQITTAGACSGTGIGTGTITMTGGSATCYVYYNQAGNDTYDPASSATESTALELNLTITLSGTGNGSVTSGNGIDCSWNGIETSGTYSLTTGYNGNSFDLDESAGSCSFFNGWSGACVGQGVACRVTMNQDRTVGASFELYPLVMLSTPQEGYTTLKNAYRNTSGGTLYIRTHPFGEELVLDRVLDVIFDSGWNCDFTGYSGYSGIISLEVDQGSLELKGGALLIGP